MIFNLPPLIWKFGLWLFSHFLATILLQVFWAHVLQDQVYFIPSVGELHDVHAKAGTIRFYRHGPNGKNINEFFYPILRLIIESDSQQY